MGYVMNVFTEQCACNNFYEPQYGCGCTNGETIELTNAFAMLVETPERVALKRVRHQLALHPDDWGRLIAGIDEVLN